MINSYHYYPIKNKIRNILLLISISSVLAISTIGRECFMKLHEDSVEVIDSLVKENLNNLLISKVDILEFQLRMYKEFTANVSTYLHNIYLHSEDYKSKEVYPAQSDAHLNVFTIKRILANSTIKYENIKNELSMLANVESLWEPFSRSSKWAVKNLYLGTKTGFVLSYNATSQFEIPKANNTEVYYDYYGSTWYNLGYIYGKDVSTKKSISNLHSNIAKFTPVYTDSSGRGSIISCIAPFFDANDSIAGVTGIDILALELYKNLIDMSSHENYNAILFDEKGTIISSSSPEDNKSLRNRLGFKIMSQISQRKQDIILSNGIYYAFMPLESTNWKYCIYISEEKALSIIYEFGKREHNVGTAFFIVITLIIISIFLYSHVLSKQLSLPIMQLIKGMEIVSNGNFEYRTNIKSDDEIGLLSNKFNDMVMAIQLYSKLNTNP